MSRLTLEQKTFDPTSISAETLETNQMILDLVSKMDDPWAAHPRVAREARRTGKGAFPKAPRSDRARTETIAGPGGPLDLRIIAPENPDGIYLHVHGGGWVIGGPEQQDPRLERVVDNCNMAVVSVDYRLAPEDPFPAGPDDCEAAALWLVENAAEKFGTKRMVIGGESAGAHLSALTLLRLRDQHDLSPFSGANLVAGVFDVGLSPSARNWGDEMLILNTRDMENYARCFLSNGEDPHDPVISPLYADLTGLPPALFTVGTRDPLLDDTLFMSARWLAAGNKADLAIYPGGAHVFMAFPGKQSSDALARIEAFISAC